MYTLNSRTFFFCVRGLLKFRNPVYYLLWKERENENRYALWFSVRWWNLYLGIINIVLFNVFFNILLYTFSWNCIFIHTIVITYKWKQNCQVLLPKIRYFINITIDRKTYITQKLLMSINIPKFVTTIFFFNNNKIAKIVVYNFF